MLLNVMLPKGEKEATLPSAVGELSNPDSHPAGHLRNTSNMAEFEHCPIQHNTGTEGTGCGSGVSEVMCTQNPSVLTQDDSYD
ncbi:hypothetical protein KC19_VG129700 [Ceratodon purpureus]|uniref:Uncharacterized protein n=1 Tax=Ceratodon purpureus TaxID=3225 RepID=A0A8T0HQL5_CERPU|nr:hypothetical protein KC19_VG129700 [Ceratodon purpureus]